MPPRKKPPLHKKQRALLELLRKRDGKEVKEADVLGITGWSAKSWKVYRTNGLYSPFLVELSERRFRVRCGPDVTDWAFYKAVTQTKAGSKFAPRCKDDLARALAARSRDNMVLALELYNRPSLRNRIDGFALLFCAAWEQLLKAEVIEEEGEAKIYRPKKTGRPRETVSLRDAMALRLDPKSALFKNLSYVTDLRDKAAHLLMPEVRSTLGYLFQAGILNYANRFAALTGDAFLDDTTGLVSLVGDDQAPPTAVLVRTYGSITGEEMGELLDRLRTDIASAGDREFAISVEHKLVLTKNADEGDIHLSSASTGQTDAVVVTREVPTESKYPFLTRKLCTAVTERAGVRFTTHDLLALTARTKWKNGDNEFHKFQSVTGTHLYSEAALEWIVKKLDEDPSYLSSARESLRQALRKKKTGRKSSRKS